MSAQQALAEHRAKEGSSGKRKENEPLLTSLKTVAKGAGPWSLSTAFGRVTSRALIPGPPFVSRVLNRFTDKVVCLHLVKILMTKNNSLCRWRLKSQRPAKIKDTTKLN